MKKRFVVLHALVSDEPSQNANEGFYIGAWDLDCPAQLTPHILDEFPNRHSCKKTVDLWNRLEARSPERK